MSTIFKAPTSNQWTGTVDGTLAAAAASVVLISASGLQYPGVITVDRGTSKREDISYTGISTDTLTGCVRGINGTTDVEHIDAVVDSGMNSKVWNDMVDLFDNIYNSDGSLIRSVTTDADAATVTFDLSDGLVHVVSITADRTFAISNDIVGQVFIIKVIQGAGGSHTPVWFSTIKWEDGNEPELSAAAGDADMFVFVVTGTGTYDGFHSGTEL